MVGEGRQMVGGGADRQMVGGDGDGSMRVGGTDRQIWDHIAQHTYTAHSTQAQHERIAKQTQHTDTVSLGRSGTTWRTGCRPVSP